MIRPYNFTNENLKNGFKVNLESHNVNHTNSISTITTKYTDFGFETIYINKIIREMATSYARLINQNKFKYHIIFSACFFRNNEEDQRSDKLNSLSFSKLIII